MHTNFLKLTNLFKIRRNLAFIFLLLCWSTPYAQEHEISWRAAQKQAEEWYGNEEAQRIADNVLLYQNDNGGWHKNVAMAKTLKNEEKKALEKDKSKETGTTIDNGATHTQMRYLAKVYKKTQNESYKESFLKGIDYLLAAQYDNGGWPQYYPIREGYYEHITYNDHAMIGVMDLLRAVATGKEEYTFVDDKRKKQAQIAIEKGLAIILKTQIHVDGKLTVWCAQHHREDLSPAKARAYELPSLSGGESVGIVEYLMQIENPSEAVKSSIRGAVSWFEQHQINNKKVVTKDAPELPEGRDRIVVEDENAGPLWARFNEIGTGRPFFVGRDGVAKNELSQIEHERRIGYSYLSNYAEDLLKKNYPEWEERL